jgi:polysaccharide biosynthesis PFTS motif protein
MGPIAPLREARRYVVQALGAIGSANPAQCTYHRVPLFALALENPVGATGFSRFLLEHTRALLAYLRAVARFRAMCIIGRDFAYHASASRLDAQGLIENVIITNSNYSAQPLWMRRHAGRGHSTHMVWYSQNCIPFVYAFDPVRTQLPNHRHLAFDETWAWTEGFADYIRSVGVKAAIHVVGPIMFYLPEPDAGPRREGELRIMVFDVTPVRPEIARRIGLVYNYYSTDNVLGFIGDIVSAARNIEAQLGKKVRVALKHKRTHEPTRDPRYVAAIERLADDEGALELEPPEANVYSLAAAADVVIAVPYSSPVYVAQDAGTAALYYDATGELIPAHEAAADIPFAARSVELEEKLLEILGGCARRPPPAVEPSYPRTA